MRRRGRATNAATRRSPHVRFAALAHADPAPYRALVRPPKARHIDVIDQRALPHALVRVKIGDAEAAALAIRRMWIRGAPLIGAVGAYGMALALDRDASDGALAQAHAALDATRPTAINLRWALDRVRAQGRRRSRRRRAPMRRGPKPTPSPPKTSRSTMRSANMVSRCCAASRSGARARFA